MSLISPQQYDALKPGQRIWLGVITAFSSSSGETEFEVGRTTYSKKYDVYSKTLYMVGADGKPITQGRAPWTLFKRPNGVSLGHGGMGTVIKSFRMASTNDGTDMRRLAELRALRRLAVKLPSEEDQGKPSYDEDFRAGFVAGTAAYAKDDSISKADADKAYKRVSNKHGSWWVDGYTAAIDIKRGATATTPAQIAKKMKLAAFDQTAAGSMSYLDEIATAAKNVAGYKAKLVEAVVKKATQVLKANGILVTTPHIDLNPHYGGFAIVILEMKLAGASPTPIDRWAFRDKIDTILDHGWQVTWMGTEGQMEFEFPTR